MKFLTWLIVAPIRAIRHLVVTVLVLAAAAAAFLLWAAVSAGFLFLVNWITWGHLGLICLIGSGLYFVGAIFIGIPAMIIEMYTDRRLDE